MLFAFSLFCLGSTHKFDDIFAPLSLETVTVAHDGTVFAINSSDYVIIRVDTDGSQTTFSRQGQGPSELMAPVSIHYDGNEVFLFDFVKGVLVFDLEGTFKRAFRLPHQNVIPCRVAGGWIYSVNPFDNSKDSSLVWSNSEGTKHTILATYKDSGSNLFIKESGPGFVKLDFNPALDRLNYALSLDKKTLYCYLPGASNILVFDMTMSQKVHSFNLDHGRKSFDTNWGQARIDMIARNTTLNGSKVKALLTPKFPETFPMVREMAVGPDGNIWIRDESSYYNENAPLSCYYPDGTKARLNLDNRLFGRLAAVNGDDAFILGYDSSTENPLIYKVAKGEINQAFKETIHLPTEKREPGLSLHQ